MWWPRPPYTLYPWISYPYTPYWPLLTDPMYMTNTMIATMIYTYQTTLWLQVYKELLTSWVRMAEALTRNIAEAMKPSQ